jgi:hypothetical protein
MVRATAGRDSRPWWLLAVRLGVQGHGNGMATEDGGRLPHDAGLSSAGENSATRVASAASKPGRDSVWSRRSFLGAGNDRAEASRPKASGFSAIAAEIGQGGEVRATGSLLTSAPVMWWGRPGDGAATAHGAVLWHAPGYAVVRETPLALVPPPPARTTKSDGRRPAQRVDRLPHRPPSADPRGPAAGPPPRLLDRVRSVMRARHLSPRTGTAPCFRRPASGPCASTST